MKTRNRDRSAAITFHLTEENKQILEDIKEWCPSKKVFINEAISEYAQIYLKKVNRNIEKLLK